MNALMCVRLREGIKKISGETLPFWVKQPKGRLGVFQNSESRVLFRYFFTYYSLLTVQHAYRACRGSTI